MRIIKKINPVEKAADLLLFLSGLFAVSYIFFSLFNFPDAGGIARSVCLFGLVLGVVNIARSCNRIVGWIIVGLIIAFSVYLALNIVEMVQLGAHEIFVRYIVPNLNRLVYYEFPKQPVSTLSEELLCTRFSIFVSMFYAIVLCEAVVALRSRVASLALTIPVFAFAYALQGLPSIPMLVLMFSFWIVMLIKPKHHSSEVMMSHITAAASAVMAALLMTFLLNAFPPEDFKAHPDTGKWRQQVIDMSVDLQNNGIAGGVFGFGSGAPLTSSDGNINLNSVGNARFPEKDILRVYTDMPENMYLRGYSAALYDGNKWEQLEAGELSGTGISEDSMQYLKENSAARETDPGRRVTVEALTDKSNYSFTPYMLTSMEPNQSFINDSYYPGGEISSSIFMSCGSRNFNGQEDVIKRKAAEIETAGDSGAIQVSDSSELQKLRCSLYYAPKDAVTFYNDTEMYYAGESGIYFNCYSIENEMLGVSMTGNTQPAQSNSENDLANYSFGDIEYIRGFKQVYTQLPDGMDDVVLTWWLTQQGISPDDPLFQQHIGRLKDTSIWEWDLTAYDIAKTVQSSGTYSKSPGNQPMNRDFVEYFLNERNVGYCVHYASASVTLLRAMGIPSRYVEGYVVRQDDFDKEGVAVVEADRAHSWAEYWMPGVGWTPIESTPGGASPVIYTTPEDIMSAVVEIEDTRGETEEAEQDEDSGIEDDMQTDNQLTDNEDAPEEETEPQVMLEEKSYLLPIILIVILSIAVIAVTARFIFVFSWKRKFKNDDISYRVLVIYSFMELLCRFGIEMPESAVEIAQKAKFSSKGVDRGELADMYRSLDKCRAELKNALPPWKWQLLRLAGIENICMSSSENGTAIGAAVDAVVGEEKEERGSKSGRHNEEEEEK